MDDAKRDAIRFRTLLLTIAEKKYRASCFTDDASDFLDGIYRDYLEAGSPRNRREWIAKRLEGEFPYVDKLPEWVEGKGSCDWPFRDGKPMVFVGQIGPVPENDVTRTVFTFDVVIYIFGARIPGEREGTHRIVYELVEQIPGFGGTGLR